ncbi:MAG: glycosyltransferase family 2 protein [Ignavibacteriales bacterium]|nr:glycosyltransferase family 2 protein [Ignavibacteriales bacterium]
MNRPPVSIIILNHNGKNFLDACLTGVLAQAYPAFEIILVDNGSSDGSVEFVREKFPAIRVVALESNQGFAGGNNRGVEAARHDLIVLLNNDTRVEEGWLKALVDAVEPDDVAAASSLILTDGIPARYYEKNGSINFLGHNIMRVFEKREDIFFAGGASLMYKRNILGLPFDEDYFAYAEDVHLSLRARFLGLRVLHVHDSVVHHFGSGTSKQQAGSFVTFLQERNRLLNTLVFFSPVTLFRIAPLLLLTVAAKLAVSLVGGKYSVAGLMRAYGWLLFHPGAIGGKRRSLEKERRVHERVVIARMTCKLTNGESAAGRLVNAVMKLYFSMVNLRTIEFPER